MEHVKRDPFTFTVSPVNPVEVHGIEPQILEPQNLGKGVTILTK